MQELEAHTLWNKPDFWNLALCLPLESTEKLSLCTLNTSAPLQKDSTIQNIQGTAKPAPNSLAEDWFPSPRPWDCGTRLPVKCPLQAPSQPSNLQLKVGEICWWSTPSSTSPLPLFRQLCCLYFRHMLSFILSGQLCAMLILQEVSLCFEPSQPHRATSGLIILQEVSTWLERRRSLPHC